MRFFLLLRGILARWQVTGDGVYYSRLAYGKYLSQRDDHLFLDRAARRLD